MVSLKYIKKRRFVKLISRNTDYAIRAICYMAKERDKVISASELVNALKIPRPFLRKILQGLNKEGVLISNKGKGGGFRLGRPASKILLLDIMEVFQGPFRLNECMFKKEICPNRKSCWLKKKLGLIEDMVISELRTITIESILKGR